MASRAAHSYPHAMLAGSLRSRGPAGAVALTFDDGPDPAFTPQILEVLARHDVRATFFCVGRRAVTAPDLVRRIRAAGHAVGSHSHTHRAPFEITPWDRLADY